MITDEEKSILTNYQIPEELHRPFVQIINDVEEDVYFDLRYLCGILSESLRDLEERVERDSNYYQNL